MKHFESMIDAIKALKSKNFNHNFRLTDEGAMECLETGKSYTAEEMRIVKYFRFEGQSNPSDMSIVFAVVCDDGTKGIITSSYGPYADMKLLSFMDSVKIIDQEGAGKMK